MEQRSVINTLVSQLLEQVCALPQDGTQLEAIASYLGDFAISPIWQDSPYRESLPGEELVYELGLSPGGGPALYLVSDGVGVISPPHCHTTWAVIAGIRGHELNHTYIARSIEEKATMRVAEFEVGPGESIILGADEIHSTEVRGVGPTYHLHLYGKALHELPAFESRCYVGAVELTR